MDSSHLSVTLYPLPISAQAPSSSQPLVTTIGCSTSRSQCFLDSRFLRSCSVGLSLPGSFHFTYCPPGVSTCLQMIRCLEVLELKSISSCTCTAGPLSLHLWMDSIPETSETFRGELRREYCLSQKVRPCGVCILQKKVTINPRWWGRLSEHRLQAGPWKGRRGTQLLAQSLTQEGIATLL
nr:uncharacterized protein LOC112428915 isoform X2 [Macaca nemestrina]